MDVTANEFFPYPEGNDPGAGALDLQLLAEAIDASIQEKTDHFRAVINRPCRVRRLSANSQFQVSANVESDIPTIGGTSWVELYSNPGSTPGILRPWGIPGLGTTPGIYRLGACIISNPTGAVNNLTSRQVTITATIPSDPTNFPINTVTRRAQSVTFETSIGGQFQMAELEVLTPYPSNNNSANAGTVFGATFLHANTSSTVQFLPGSMTWIFRVGDVEG